METPPRSTDPPSRTERPAPHASGAGGPGVLPVSLTSFIGRDDEIDLARSLLQRSDLRLLTLTGPGGIGKTRLSIEIAARCSEQFHDGVRFVSLASIQDPSMVMMAVAAAPGLHELDRAQTDEIVASSLGTDNVLLVVGNFEQVTDAAPAVTRLLARCLRLKVMVTSRSLLRVEGEHAIPVPRAPGWTAAGRRACRDPHAPLLAGRDQ